MSHHSSETPFGDFTPESFKDLENQLKNLGLKTTEKTPLDLGPTGKYPDGKIADNDEGEIRIGITTLNGKVVFDFGKPIRTVGLTKDQAVDIANVLFERAREL